MSRKPRLTSGAREPRRAPGIRWSAIGAVAVPLALWAAPVGAFAWLVQQPPGLEREQLVSSLPTTTRVGSREQTLTTSVRTTVEFDEPPLARAAVSGLVTAVHVKVGDRPVSGTPLIDVGGVPVLAYFGSQPFYRDLETGESGADVTALNSFLASLGYDVPTESDAFRWSTKAAVMHVQDSIGVEADGIFRTGYVAYLPPELQEVAAVTLHVGAIAQSGDQIITGPAPIKSAIFTPADANQSLAPLAAAPLTVELDDNQSVAIASLTMTAEELSAVSAALVQSHHITPQMRLSGEQVDIDGVRLRLQTARQTGSVIGTALYTGPTGTTCLFATDGGGARALPIDGPVAAGTEIGQAIVPIELEGIEVFRDPSTLAEDVQNTCG